jgi:hypothetical protein
MIDVNFWAVLGAAVAAMIIGGLWYSPLMFGKKWLRMMGMDPNHKPEGASKAMAISFVGALVMGYVLFHFLVIVERANIEGITVWGVAFWVWLGFVATTTINDFIYNPRPKPWSLYILNNANILATLYAMTWVIEYIR